MAVKKTFEIPLDTKRPLSSRAFAVVEGDTGNVLIIFLTDDGVPVDLSGCRVMVIFALDDGRTVEQDNNGNGITVGGADHNEVTIDLYSGSFAPDNVNCELQVYSTSTETYDTLITTAKFSFQCRRSIANEDTLQSTSEWPLLQNTLRELEDIRRGVQADYAEEDTGNPAYVRNKPEIGVDVQAPTDALPGLTALTNDDAFPVYDTSAAAHKKTTWANIKEKLAGAFSSLIHAAQHGPSGADPLTPEAIGAATATALAALAAQLNSLAAQLDGLTPAAIGAAGLSSGKVLPAQASAAIGYITSSRALALSDAGLFTPVNSTSAITVTVPLNSTVAFPVGTELELARFNTGTVTIAPASGVTLIATPSLNGARTIAGLYGVVALKKYSTDAWLLSGALA